MKVRYTWSTAVFFCLCMLPTLAAAQYERQVFALPEAHAGEEYSVAIEDLLRAKYQLKLETNSSSSIIRWSLVSGSLPQGLTARTDGTISGTPEGSSEQAHRFVLSATDATAKDDSLAIEFNLTMRPRRLRLIQVSGPKLIPIASPASDNAPTSGDERVATRSRDVPPNGASPTIQWSTPGITDSATIDPFTEAQQHLAIKVNDANVCTLYVRVRDENDLTIFENQQMSVDRNNALQKIEVKLAKGRNIIKITPYKKRDASKDCEQKATLDKLDAMNDKTLSLTVVCATGECGTAVAKKDDAGQSPYSSRNTRAIFGIEQAGASSAASESNPFMDFFFNRPLSGKRVWAWGDVRLTTTAQQVGAFVSSTSNAAGAVTGDKINDLATSFDFKLGTEFLLNHNDQRNQVSFITGFGATSPLTSPTQSPQIFKVPTDQSNSQYAAFFSDYPEATGKTFIAFVRPERDRFLRQYFAGLRLKSYPTEDKFPSMLDVTFGQNAGVTGGQLRHFVLGIDGSYHLNLGERSLYIFGSTNLKFGGDKTVRTPYVLEPADSAIKLTSPGLVITSRQMNRDVFRIGFGVDLVELFKPKSDNSRPK